MSSPKRLPVIYLGNRQYFFDRKLAQLRCVDRPSQRVDLSDLEEGILEFMLIISEISGSVPEK